MPKKKSKKPRQKNNKKQETAPPPPSEKSKVQNEEEEPANPTTTDEITITDVDGVQINIDLDSQNKVENDEQVGKNSSAQEENTEIAETTTPSVKKKGFSFLKNKKLSSSELPANPENSNTSMESEEPTKGTKVKRAHSISTFGRDEHQQKSKIPTYKSHYGSKKKGITASCSNVESTSLVLNPGMDSWRMEGLLGTIEKSNSIHSLNTSGTSQKKEEPNVSLASPLPAVKPETKPEEVEMKEQPKRDVVEPPKIKETEVTPAPKVESAAKPEIQANGGGGGDKNNIGEDYTETNIDFEYSAEIHDDKKKNNKNKKAATVDKTPASPVDTSVTAPVVKSKDPTTAKETTKEPEKPSTNDSGGSSVSAPSVEPGSPTMKDALTDADLYKLENNSVVSVRNLKDVLLERHIQLPEEIITNDWLVLNLTSAPVIESF